MTGSKNPPAPSALTPEMEKVIVRCLVVVFVVLVVSSAALSCVGLHEFGVRSGWHPVLAWLAPVCCDVFIAAALLAGLYATLNRTSTWYAWFCVVLGTGMSVAGNVAAAPPDLGAKIAHGAAPVVLAMTLELLLDPIRQRAGVPVRRARRTSAIAPTTAPAPAPTNAPAKPVKAPTGKTEQTAQTAGLLPANEPQADGKRVSKAAACRALVAQDPTITISALVEQTGIDKSEARKIRARLNEQQAA